MCSDCYLAMKPKSIKLQNLLPAVGYRQKQFELVSAGLALYAEKISIP